MKKSILILSSLFIGLSVLSSCSDDESSVETPIEKPADKPGEVAKGAKELKLAEEEVSLKIGDKKEVKIISGNGTYSVKSSTEHAKATIVEGMIIIEAISTGNAVVTVTDAEKKAVSIKVNVLMAEPIVLKLQRGGAELTAYKTDTDETFFNVNVDDVITLEIEGGTGSGQYIKSEADNSTYLDFTNTVADSDGHAVIQNNSVSIEIKSSHDKNVHFTIMDTDGKETKAIVFAIRGAGDGDGPNIANYTFTSGFLTGITDEAIDVNGKLIIPASVKKLGSSDPAAKFIITAAQADRLKEVKIGTEPGAENIKIGAYAFQYFGNLEKVTLGSKVVIGKAGDGIFAFQGTNLKELIIFNSTPPLEGKIGFAFNGVSGATLKVPFGSEVNYSDDWAAQFTIEEMP